MTLHLKSKGSSEFTQRQDRKMLLPEATGDTKTKWESGSMICLRKFSKRGV